jgi:nucleotide-binding universal stress UspA family protein
MIVPQPVASAGNLPNAFERILVAVDFSETTDAVVERASVLARLSDAELRLLHVAAPNPDFVGFEAGPDTVRNHVAEELREEHRALEALAEFLVRSSVRAHPLMVRGPTARTIVEQARRFGADLIVVGSRSHGALRRLLQGSVAEGVLHESAVPVLVVPFPRAEPASRSSESG